MFPVAIHERFVTHPTLNHKSIPALQEHFNAYARPRGSHIADDIIEPDGRNWF
jgi:hypothetical protein